MAQESRHAEALLRMQSAALGALAQKLGLRADPIRVGAWAKSSDDRTVCDLIVRENAGLRGHLRRVAAAWARMLRGDRLGG